MIVTALRLIAALTILTGSAGGSSAADTWTAARITDGSVPKIIVPETRLPAPDGLPDGLVETLEQSGDIAAAWYAEDLAKMLG